MDGLKTIIQSRGAPNVFVTYSGHVFRYEDILENFCDEHGIHYIWPCTEPIAEHIGDKSMKVFKEKQLTKAFQELELQSKLDQVMAIINEEVKISYKPQ
jgi:hypothetical protein